MRRSAYNTPASACSETIALVLAGGAGTRLKSLTQKHAKPAVNFAGKYRTIDFNLTNCVHSSIRRISILTQYKSHSLNTYIQQCHQAPPSHYMEHFAMISMRIPQQEHAQVDQCFHCHRPTHWNDIRGTWLYDHH